MSNASTLIIPSQVAIHPQPLVSASTILYRGCSNCQTKGQQLCALFWSATVRTTQKMLC
jgi:hypothetical protein